MPARGRIPIAAIVGAALLLAVPVILPEWMKFIVTLALAKFLAVLSVALFLRSGMVTFGHAMFYAAGAYVVGFSHKWFAYNGIVVLFVIGAFVGAGVAALVGLVMARYREVFFAMLNLAFSMMLYGALLKLYWFTGGTDGLSSGLPSFLGYTPSREYLRDVQYYTTVVAVGAVIYGMYRFMESPLGHYIKARADNEIRIEYSGESVRRVIYVTYVLSGALAGMGGVLAAFTVGHIVPEYAFWIQSGEFVFIALLGGFESVPGPLVGAIAFEFIRTYASKYFPNEWQMVLGIIMLVIILFRPGGLWAIYEGILARFRRHESEVAGG
jgi:ABC-type branched-subunit amino acid transport system permease subunit